LVHKYTPTTQIFKKKTRTTQLNANSRDGLLQAEKAFPVATISADLTDLVNISRKLFVDKNIRVHLRVSRLFAFICVFFCL